MNTTLDSLDDIKRELGRLLVLDPRLVPIAKVAGPLPLRRSKPGFESLAAIIVSQQVSRASADAITARLVALGALHSAQAFDALGDEILLNSGLSRPKLKTLRLVCAAAKTGELDFDGLCAMEAEAAMAALTSIAGIGPWTAQVYLLFCAGQADIFPSGDVALQNALQTIFALHARPSAKLAGELALQWRPHRGTASRLLWAYYGVMRSGG